MPRTTIKSFAKSTRFEPPEGQVAFESVSVNAADFSGTWWDAFSATDSQFVDCDFRRARFGDALFGLVSAQTTFRRCRFDNADLRNAHPGAARFEDCHFDNAKIEGWLCFLNEFVSCHFAGRLSGVIFSGRPWGPGADKIQPPRRTNEFRHNDFSAADLIDCSFVRGIDISSQLWPTKAPYMRLDHAPQRIGRAQAIVSGWADDAARKRALLMLAAYSSGGHEEQDELFVRRDDLSDVPPDLRETVWDLLEANPTSVVRRVKGASGLTEK
jgi:hypothetical protein